MDDRRRRETFGALLRRHRAAAGLSQEALAVRSGLSREAISMLERGVRLAPRTSTVAILADALRLRPADREALVAAALPAPAEAPSPAAARVPRELPRPPADFTGRADELARLSALLEAGGAVAVSAVDGMAGVGKSALAILAAHRLVDAGAFPDGQLYVNLHGATPGLPPLEPVDALGRMLRSLGDEPAAIPAGVEEAAARFRSLVAGRRLLVLLDDASGVEQVRPLLPGSPSCAVLVTSRHVLGTLEGARSVHMDVLPAGEALELLGRIVGRDRVAAEPGAAAQVVGWCGRLPLAIRIAGARLAARPAWPIAELAAQLADGVRRLDELRAGELAVRASFDVSLRALESSPDAADRAAAAAFGLLGLPDGPDLGLPVAARLVDAAEAAAQPLLERLVDAQLLESPRPGRYQFHDLVRAYARTLPAPSPPAAALARVLGFYAATGWRTMALLRPGSWRLATADPRWAEGGAALADAREALDWLEAERANLLAAVAQVERTAAPGGSTVPAELTIQLARALFGFFVVRGNWRDCAQVNEAAVRLAGAIGDRAGEARARIDLGTAELRLGRYDAAIAHQREGIAALRDLGDLRGQAAGLDNLSIGYRWLGRYEEAIACQEESLALYEALDDRQGRGSCLYNLGVVYQRLERYQEAIACQEESLRISRALGDRLLQASCLNSLGAMLERLGRHDQAIGHLRESLAVSRALDARIAEADALNELGLVNRSLGRHREAIGYQLESLAIFRELGGRRSQAIVLRDLGDALRAAGRDADARAAWTEALAICEELRLPEAAQLRERTTGQPARS